MNCGSSINEFVTPNRTQYTRPYSRSKRYSKHLEGRQLLLEEFTQTSADFSRIKGLADHYDRATYKESSLSFLIHGIDDANFRLFNHDSCVAVGLRPPWLVRLITFLPLCSISVVCVSRVLQFEDDFSKFCYFLSAAIDFPAAIVLSYLRQSCSVGSSLGSPKESWARTMYYRS